MKLNKLPKQTKSKKKRVGRGYGSGKGGHTATRGQKGQKSRNSVPMWFEGGQLPFIRRLPFIKGKNRFKSFKETTVVNVGQLNIFKKDQIVNRKNLNKKGLISLKESKGMVKILGRGKIEKSLTIKLPTSKQAKKKIEKAGGKVILEKKKDEQKKSKK